MTVHLHFPRLPLRRQQRVEKLPLEIARVLRRKGLEIRGQEHFSQGAATLIERLRDYIPGLPALPGRTFLCSAASISSL